VIDKCFITASIAEKKAMPSVATEKGKAMLCDGGDMARP